MSAQPTAALSRESEGAEDPKTTAVAPLSKALRDLSLSQDPHPSAQHSSSKQGEASSKLETSRVGPNSLISELGFDFPTDLPSVPSGDRQLPLLSQEPVLTLPEFLDGRRLLLAIDIERVRKFERARNAWRKTLEEDETAWDAVASEIADMWRDDEQRFRQTIHILTAPRDDQGHLPVLCD